MNEYLKKALETQHDRKPVFEEILNTFNKQPIDVLVVGAERATTPESIYGDGFASLYFASYIKKYGGSLTIVDIDPTSFNQCTKIMSDFLSEIALDITCGDGISYIENKNWDLVYLDGPDDPNVNYEQFKKCNLNKSNILCDDFHGKFVRVRKDFQEFVLFKCNYLHEMGFYPKVYNNDVLFKVGNQGLEYIREKPNRSWYNERAMELGLAKYFSNTHYNIVEIGDVSFQYSYFRDWTVIDCAPVYSKAIKKSVLDKDLDLVGTNVLSISTLEHVGEGTYNKGKQDLRLACAALDRICKEAKNYLITIPIGANVILQDYIKDSGLPYTIMRRLNKRGSTNNWIEDKDLDYFQETYGHFDYGLSYYGNALYVLVLTNDKNLINY